jgi:hypothetical protein
MPWWQIIAILVVVAVVLGVCVGLLGSALNISTGWGAAGIGAAVGVIGATLVRRRNDAK